MDLRRDQRNETCYRRDCGDIGGSFGSTVEGGDASKQDSCDEREHHDEGKVHDDARGMHADTPRLKAKDGPGQSNGRQGRADEDSG